MVGARVIRTQRASTSAALSQSSTCLRLRPRRRFRMAGSARRQIRAIHNWTLELHVVQPPRVYPGMQIGQVTFWRTGR